MIREIDGVKYKPLDEIEFDRYKGGFFVIWIFYLTSLIFFMFASVKMDVNVTLGLIVLFISIFFLILYTHYSFRHCTLSKHFY
jgi:hypothetical protein